MFPLASELVTVGVLNPAPDPQPENPLLQIVPDGVTLLLIVDP